jgi:purine-nucleoside/S-methyl-5'-thioadenosine phosphorylase / adenosine deaminase
MVHETTVSYQLIEEEGHRALGLNMPGSDVGVRHLFGLRGGRPIEFLAKRFGIPKDRVVSVRQEHGDSIRVVDASTENGRPSRHTTHWAQNQAYDALITDRKGIAITVRTADCLPILIWDPERKVAAAVHAGWRGSLKAIAPKAVFTMCSSFGSRPEDLWVGIGPAIGPCCYEVDGPVLEPLQEEFEYWKDVVRVKENGKGMLDLAGLNVRQLTAAGVPSERVTLAGVCTFCHPERFYSYRRQGETAGGMISGIMIGP